MYCALLWLLTQILFWELTGHPSPSINEFNPDFMELPLCLPLSGYPIGFSLEQLQIQTPLAF